MQLRLGNLDGLQDFSLCYWVGDGIIIGETSLNGTRAAHTDLRGWIAQRKREKVKIKLQETSTRSGRARDNDDDVEERIEGGENKRGENEITNTQRGENFKKCMLMVLMCKIKD